MAYQAMANFKIDNFSIKNTDDEAAKKVAETPAYKSNIRDKTPDFDYTTVTDKNDLLGEKLKNGGTGTQKAPANNAGMTVSAKGCGSSFGAGAALAALIPAGVILLRRKNDEE